MNLKDNNGKTPLALAKGRNYSQIISYLDQIMKLERYCSIWLVDIC